MRPITDQRPQNDLGTRLKSGDANAVDELVDQYGARLVAFVRVFLRSQEASEDVVQEVFIRAWQKREQLSQGDKLEPWLFTLARNAALKESARKYVRMEQIPDSEEWMASLPDDGPGASAGLQAERAARHLEAALATLDEKRRTLMALRYFSGMSLQELADHLEMPIGSVGTTISRSLASMKKYFDDKGLKPEDLL